MHSMKTIRSLIAITLTSLAFAGSALAAELINTAGASGFALSGYDPVAFFTDQKPVNGDPGITAKHQGATYMFATKEHQQAFEANPGKYAPQYGGVLRLRRRAGCAVPGGHQHLAGA